MSAFMDSFPSQVVRAIGMDVTPQGVLLLSTTGPGFSTKSIQLTVRPSVKLLVWVSGICSSRQTHLVISLHSITSACCADLNVLIRLNAVHCVCR
jgi:hypothetical protein